jgi:membrane-associated protease RseP (regulator of RpoE activity)
MIKKMLLLVFVALSIQVTQAAENLYEKNYKVQNAGDLKSLSPNPETKMYVSNHYDDDNISMLEDGYDMMGSSGFEAESIAPDMALEHAKSIKADVVLVYSKYASKKSELSKLQMIKEAAKSTGEIEPEILNDGGEQYKYYASYWAKLPMPILGLHVIKLKQKSSDSDVMVAEDGLKILAVIKDSPAAKAGLKRGDVLMKLGGVSLQKPEELALAARKYQGKKVEIAFVRNAVSSVTHATLNSR